MQDERGASDFDALKFAVMWQPQRLLFYSFDLLCLNGKDLRNRPLPERRAELKKLIGRNPKGPLQFSEEFAADAAAFFRPVRRERAVRTLE
jgi:bifunctional non-homologous end joining protein LigD